MRIPKHATELDLAWVNVYLGDHLPAPPVSVASARVGATFGLAGVTYRAVVRMRSGSLSFAVKVCALEAARHEAWAYRNVLPCTSVLAPTFVDLFEADPHGVVVTRFVEGATQGDVLAGCAQSQTLALAQVLGDLHAPWWGTADDDLPESFHYVPSPVQPVADDVIDRCVLRHQAWISGGGEALRGRLGDPTEAAATLATQPMTVAHRDFHLDNVLFAEHGPVLLDWERARRAPACVDFARFLVECHLPAQRKNRRDMARRVYLDRLAEHGVSLDPAVFESGIAAAHRILLAGAVRWGGREEAAPAGSRQENLQRNLLRNLTAGA